MTPHRNSSSNALATLLFLLTLCGIPSPPWCSLAAKGRNLQRPLEQTLIVRAVQSGHEPPRPVSPGRCSSVKSELRDIEAIFSPSGGNSRPVPSDLPVAHSQARLAQVNQVPFQQMLADDGTFTVQVPYGWQKMGPAMFEGSSVVSNWGEAFGSGLVAVYANQFLLQTLLDAQKTFLPHHQRLLLSRRLWPPSVRFAFFKFPFPKFAV